MQDLTHCSNCRESKKANDVFKQFKLSNEQSMFLQQSVSIYSDADTLCLDARFNALQ